MNYFTILKRIFQKLVEKSRKEKLNNGKFIRY